MGLFDKIEPPVVSVLKMLFNEPRVSKSIVYKRYSGQEYDQELKANVVTYDDFPLSALRLSHSIKSQLVGLSNIQIGDQAYVLMGSEAPSGMTLKDIIVDENGKEQTIKSADDIFGIATALTIDSGD